jgi:hypothetical protein
MISEYLDTEDELNDKYSETERNIRKNTDSGKRRGSIEKRGPVKDKNYKVLHKDGSFADLPDKEGEGSGALDGTVGRGM